MAYEAITDEVKLVIWDLDDTFWSGTLSEEGISFIPGHAKIVRTLCQRGIISSVVSKNDFEAAKAKLVECEVWPYLVFARIAFAPKGQAVAQLIEDMNLRAENVLFIDDNPLNLREAVHYSPSLMVSGPEIIATLLDCPAVAGKQDADLTRLRQYQRLEAKQTERQSTSLSNENFLRECEIRVRIDYDLAPYWDRVIELANRTNQLNYTKKRLETPESRDELRRLLSEYGYAGGVVSAADRYGDYGVVGFFIQRRSAHRNELIHFVFSCRAMNMGVEQYVYERLGKPAIDIAPPVSNPITCFESIDWISEGDAEGIASGKRLVLIGGCELLQMAAICSDKRTEFVNGAQRGWLVRFDDPYFIQADPDAIRADESLSRLKVWNADDVVKFQAAIAEAEVVISALYLGSSWNYFQTPAGNRARVLIPNLRRLLEKDAVGFLRDFQRVALTFEQRIELVQSALSHMKRAAPNAAHFTLGSSTHQFPEGNDEGRTARAAYNEAMRSYCDAGGIHFVDVDSLTTPSDIMPPGKNGQITDHLQRRAYVAIAQHILART